MRFLVMQTLFVILISSVMVMQSKASGGKRVEVVGVLHTFYND